MGDKGVDLSVELCGLKLKNPLILASGILGTTAGLLKRVEREGAGAVTTKTVTKERRDGYPNPVIVVLEHGLINAMGLPNPGIEHFVDEIRRAKSILTVPLIVSIAGSTPDEFQYIAEAVRNTGADAIELNLSCPHVSKVGMDVGSDPDLVYEIVKEVRRVVDIPILAKLSAMVPNIVEIGRAAIEAGASGLVAINTIRAMAIDVYARRPILSNLFGGLSGPAIRPIAVRCVYELYEELKAPIIGVGGVLSWRDALEFILAGATAVGIGTAIAIRGLKVFKEIEEGLTRYMIEEGFSKIRELIGLAHENPV
ncbi:MAG: dihydroorotate dehydrogenase [Thermoprotei archaeon]|nr:MAG: dihydroorotate dehydrogenase [Thermoprotei archaeon]